MGNQPNRIQWARRRAHSSPPSRVPSFGCGSATAAAVSLSNGKPQCELRHLAFCNWDSIARARSRVADLKESKSVRVAHVTNSPLLVSKSGLKTSSSSNSICRMHHELRGGRPKYRAQRSAHRLQKRTIKCASPETVSRNGQSLPRQMRSCLVLPRNRPSRVPRASCACAPARSKVAVGVGVN